MESYAFYDFVYNGNMNSKLMTYKELSDKYVISDSQVKNILDKIMKQLRFYQHRMKN